MNFTPKGQRTARNYSMNVDELAFVDLVACGWDRRDAFIATINIKDLNDMAMDRYIREILARPKAKERLSDLKIGTTATEAEIKTDDDITEATSKESMLRDLVYARKKTKYGSREWLDISKMIADITRMKQEEIETEDSTVHFYLPLTCSRCAKLMELQKDKE